MRNKIMVVDDEEDLKVLIKQRFRQKIRQNEYEFIFAQNGKHALEQLLDHPNVDLILSDINMPEMDGLTLLTKLAEQNSLIKSVIVSAYGDMENIRTAMNRGAFDFITKPIDFKDLEITIEKTINHVTGIKKTLQALKENNILKMYVDETVLNFMGGKKMESALFDNETVEGSVAFIDICGFTAITENEPADKVVAMLNAYFDIIVHEIIKEEGIVDKFLGDAVMAAFKGKFHLDRAMDACLSIRKAIHKSDISIGSKTYKPEVSIGINSGEMVWGNIGSATLRRLDYTVIGDAVNVAARLQEAAKKGQILISQSNYEKVKESFCCNLVAEIKMKNKEKPLTVYEVLS
ncbi:response regulator [Salegentibacter mishustinae]|uniref:Guanylate cyclase n=1 Tax=Salegentibacter mishustinae TaxID=270918 RepID=A0A0Q9Z321_9FLAO|nr:adenylate/guanylate cyclase domain-containing protein [Salegentibacter mishustinae]KRG27215.1 guanylate cyclase [Salegentibacter mishustinae]PNW21449.1 guanylate cyclase [Salegentibacter mishustinae]PZX62602.1 class 3 adenylate cyclase [Salegentibacter mishustinae]